jgi:20S proteasome alpha/beta subunit
MERNHMTVCIAALCDNRKALILAADKMVGTHMIETEADIHKVLRLHKDWWVMLAGEGIEPVFDIIDSSKKELAAKRKVKVQDVERALVESFREKRMAEAEAQHLAPRGWTLKRFNSPSSKVLPESLRIELSDLLREHTIPVDILIAGFDHQGEGHIFTVSDEDNRGEARRYDIPGFCAIGSGSAGADYMMTYRALSPALPLRLALYYVLEGKYYGELASGVGDRTDLYILRHGKPRINVKEEIVEEKLIKICQDLEPRLPKKKHVAILNELSGSGFKTIKKLKTKRLGGNLVIL